LGSYCVWLTIKSRILENFKGVRCSLLYRLKRCRGPDEIDSDRLKKRVANA
jgi:hypothetical protein